MCCCQNQPAPPLEPAVEPAAGTANGLLSPAQWEQKYAAAASAYGLAPAFGVFYTDSAGQFYRSYEEYSDAAPESEAPAFILFDKCPPLDSASYHGIGRSAYSADKNGVYYSCFIGHKQSFGVVPGADPATFRVLADLEAGYDEQHVFLRARQLPVLQPKGLRVYEGPSNRPVPCGADDLYFTNGRIVVQNETLMPRTGRAFRPPTGYQLVYPAAARP